MENKNQGYIVDTRKLSDVKEIDNASGSEKSQKDLVNYEIYEEINTENMETQTVDLEDSGVVVDVVEVDKEPESSERKETQPEGSDQPAGRVTRSRGPANPIQLGPRDIQEIVTASAWGVKGAIEYR